MRDKLTHRVGARRPVALQISAFVEDDPKELNFAQRVFVVVRNNAERRDDDVVVG